ncbi:very-long-chain (3R)-3-hydroxyacyl-CoA dehydratase 4 isoform X2 [Syngnathus typhle]|nr:very-long-chain (3R)-3-hydroxyacyl-CoA dehydratase 4 isoform X2 [Syngnathus typhle]
MIVRFLTFGQDALADTFHSVGLVMSFCQLLSVLEIFHIADRIEKARLLPRLIQVLEKNLLLLTLIRLDEVQSKPVVCLQLFFWNISDLLRYPHEVMCVMDAPSATMLWARYTLWIPVYVLSAVTEGDPVRSILGDDLPGDALHGAGIVVGGERNGGGARPSAACPGGLAAAPRVGSFAHSVAVAEGEAASAGEVGQEDEKEVTRKKIKQHVLLASGSQAALSLEH